MDRIFRVTVERCIACGKCELACAFAHGAEGRPARARINIFRQAPETGIPVVCLQCDEAACVAICPVGALARNDETGAIEMKRDRCVGCRMCVVSCPFGNMLWDEGDHRIQKCDLCSGDPQCVPFCPTRALEYLPADRAAQRPEPLGVVPV
jgi:anaerobic carbon-monoxide dehydrogenase iron sulfur subunit